MESPHSNFEYVDTLSLEFSLCFEAKSLRRIFSLARIHQAVSFSKELIQPEGSILDEIETLEEFLPEYECAAILRFAFWDRAVEGKDFQVSAELTAKPVGYVIFKIDRYQNDFGEMVTLGHVFEAVFKKYPHENNCIAFPREFDFCVGQQACSVNGFIYCQQGPCNKSCAHVAIRSLVMSLGEDKDLFYSRINELADQSLNAGAASPGLNGFQILTVLRSLGVECDPLEYEKAWKPGIEEAIKVMRRFCLDNRRNWEEVAENEIRIALKRSLFTGFKDRWNGVSFLDQENAENLVRLLNLPESAADEFLGEIMSLEFDISDIVGALWNRQAEFNYPYQKFLYAGVEAGGAALVGFDLTLPEGERFASHIVPVFGHTFNQDTWVPMAESAYFTMGSETRYVSSHSWLSSFLMHDDNFGPNFCVPKDYLDPSQVRFVVSVRRKGAGYGGVIAEAIALDCILSVSTAGLFENRSNIWTSRLVDSLRKGDVVLRSVSISRDEYGDHLNSIRDWFGSEEFSLYPKVMDQFLPKMIWMVEMSIPDLFPGNKRKIAEVVLDATTLDDDLPTEDFLSNGLCRLIRLPEWYLFAKFDADGGRFDESPSNLRTHVDVFKHSQDFVAESLERGA